MSIVVLDDIERLLEYVPIGPRFSNGILQVPPLSTAPCFFLCFGLSTQVWESVLRKTVSATIVTLLTFA